MNRGGNSIESSCLAASQLGQALPDGVAVFYITARRGSLADSSVLKISRG